MKWTRAANVRESTGGEDGSTAGWIERFLPTWPLRLASRLRSRSSGVPKEPAAMTTALALTVSVTPPSAAALTPTARPPSVRISLTRAL